MASFLPFPSPLCQVLAVKTPDSQSAGQPSALPGFSPLQACSREFTSTPLSTCATLVINSNSSPEEYINRSAVYSDVAPGVVVSLGFKVEFKKVLTVTTILT